MLQETAPKKKRVASGSAGNGSSSSSKRARISSQNLDSDGSEESSAITNHAPRKVASSSLLDRPSNVMRPVSDILAATA